MAQVDERLLRVGERIVAVLREVVVGPVSKGGSMSDVAPEQGTSSTQADPRDARIAELEAQLAEAQSATAAHDEAVQAAKATTTPDATTSTTTDEPEAPAEVTYEQAKAKVDYEQAKAKVDANENLTDADVAALERGPQG